MYEPEIPEPTLPLDYCEQFPEDCNWGGVETPPYVPEDIDEGYSLPVEVFNRTVPVLVSRPEPIPMPIPTELESRPAAASVPWWLVAGIVGAILVGKGKK